MRYIYKLDFCNRLLLLFGILLFFTGCAVSSLMVKVQTVKDNSAPFSQYQTYNWYQPNPAQNTNGMGIYNNRLHNNIRQAVEEELEKKGFRKSSTPQVLVAYDVAVNKPNNTAGADASAGFGYSYAYIIGYRYDYTHHKIDNYKSVTAFPQGTLIIDFIDAQQKELVWRGYTEAVVENFNSTYKTIENFVDDILDKLPNNNS